MEKEHTLDLGIIKSNLPGRPIFLKIWGSYSHNTNLPESGFLGISDVDYLGVYASNLKSLISLNPPSDSIVQESLFDPIYNKKYDLQAHEALKFANLLIKGNPGIVECLFTDFLYWESEEWEFLRSNKDRFLSQKVVEQYIGYAKGQLHRIKSEKSLHTKGGAYNTKWAYHMIRILDDGIRIARGEYPEVWKEGLERYLLMEIRAGEYSKDEIYIMVEERINKIESYKPYNLPEEGDRKLLNEWIHMVYRI